VPYAKCSQLLKDSESPVAQEALVTLKREEGRGPECYKKPAVSAF
jgi:hypothetical protein